MRRERSRGNWDACYMHGPDDALTCHCLRLFLAGRRGSGRNIVNVGVRVLMHFAVFVCMCGLRVCLCVSEVDIFSLL